MADATYLQPYIWDQCSNLLPKIYLPTNRKTNRPTKTHLKPFFYCLIDVTRLQVNPSMTACQFRRTLNDNSEDSEEHTLNIFWPYQKDNQGSIFRLRYCIFHIVSRSHERNNTSTWHCVGVWEICLLFNPFCGRIPNHLIIKFIRKPFTLLQSMS